MLHIINDIPEFRSKKEILEVRKSRKSWTRKPFYSV